jgi:steroid delta-isomerase-like uncharacterized protein
MSEQNKETARRFLEAFQSGDVDALDDIVAENAVDHDPYNPHANEGLEGAKKTVQMYRTAFPDLEFSIEFQLAEGDMVATRWIGTGTHEGELMGMQPTGKKSSVTGIAIDRIQDGKIVESWNNWDTLGMMQNIGAIPEPEAAAQA